MTKAKNVIKITAITVVSVAFVVGCIVGARLLISEHYKKGQQNGGDNNAIVPVSDTYETTTTTAPEETTTTKAAITTVPETEKPVIPSEETAPETQKVIVQTNVPTPTTPPAFTGEEGKDYFIKPKEEITTTTTEPPKNPQKDETKISDGKTYVCVKTPGGQVLWAEVGNGGYQKEIYAGNEHGDETYPANFGS